MKLEKLEYSQFDNQVREWKFESCSFEMINLIVGKNATGKTRTLNVLRALADMLSDANPLQWAEGNYRVEFAMDNRSYIYTLEYHDRKVTREELSIDGEIKLSRQDNGHGKLYAEIVGYEIDFQVDRDKIAASAKRDAVQHSYLEDLNKWARGVTRYDFGSDLGKNSLNFGPIDLDKLDVEAKINIKDTEKAIAIFLQGQRDFGDEYKQAILEDMRFMEYDIQDIGVDIAVGITIQSRLPLPTNVPSVLYVKESDLRASTQQHEMSDGMYKALSVLIQVNYALRSGQATCLLIDDIGQGLDFTRSSALVKKLFEKISGSSIQLLMATNDRFIMNAVPLEYWIVLIRKGGRVSNLNYRNSKEMFDKFQDIGLNNFDLFSSEYYKTSQE